MKRIAYTNLLEALLDLFGPILNQILTKKQKKQNIKQKNKIYAKKEHMLRGQWSYYAFLLTANSNKFGSRCQMCWELIWADHFSRLLDTPTTLVKNIFAA